MWGIMENENQYINTKKADKVRTSLFSIILPILFLIFWQYSAVKVDNNAVLPTVGRVASNFANAFDNFVGIGSIPTKYWLQFGSCVYWIFNWSSYRITIRFTYGIF